MNGEASAIPHQATPADSREHRRRTTLLPERKPGEEIVGGHKQVARALADTVKEEHGGAIALVGPYGSGKSTVVDYARHLLRDDPHVSFVTIDAWAHRGEPLLRAVLARLLERARRIPNARLSRAFSQVETKLGPPKSTAKKTTRSGLTLIGLALGALTIALPLAYAFIEPEAQNFLFKIGEWEGEIQSVPTYSAHALALVGTLVFALITWGVVERRLRQQENRTRSQGHDREATALFEQTVTVDTTETVVDRDPTSVEFENTFRQLMELMLRDPEQRVVLAVDDLDRLKDGDARTVWSALRVFADASKDQKWRKRFWIVVALTDQTLTDQARTSAGIEDSPNRDGSEAASDVWIDKSFVSVLRVPPLVPSQSASFLAKHLVKGFPEHPPSVCNDIAKVYAYLRPGDHPPRRLKRFVNDLVMSYRQHGDAIPLPGQAAFLLGGIRKSPVLHTDATAYVSGRDRDRLEQVLGRDGLLDDDWHRTAAALQFGVHPDLAAQVLAAGPIAQAIETGDAQALRAAVSSPHVLGAVLTAVRDASLSGSTQAIDNAARALTGLDKERPDPSFPSEDNDPISRAWRLLDTALAALTDLSLIDSP